MGFPPPIQDQDMAVQGRNMTIGDIFSRVYEIYNPCIKSTVYLTSQNENVTKSAEWRLPPSQNNSIFVGKKNAECLQPYIVKEVDRGVT